MILGQLRIGARSTTYAALVLTSLLFFHSRTFWSIPWCFSIGFLLHSRLIFMKSLTANKNERQKKWFLNLNCTKMSSFKLCTKMILQNFSFYFRQEYSGSLIHKGSKGILSTCVSFKWMIFSLWFS